MELGSQPYSGGPALLKGFGSQQMKEILLSGVFDNEFSLKRALGISNFHFSQTSLFPGGPNEVTYLNQGSLPKLLLILGGFGYALVADCRKESPYLDQATIFRLNSGREEGVFIPPNFALGLLFKSKNCLFLEIGGEEAQQTQFSPYGFKINFNGSCGVSESHLRSWGPKDSA